MLTKPVFEHFGMSDVLDMMFQVSQGLVRTTDAEFGVAPDSGSECSYTGEASVGGVLFHKRTRNEPLTRYEVATLCPIVVEAAQQGDWKGIEILKETILAAAPRAKAVKPQFEPMVGAVLLALSEIGVIVDDQIIEAIEQSSANFPDCRVH